MYGLGVLGTKIEAYTRRVMGANNFLKGNVEYAILNQFLRSGTSIGANCSEAVTAQSKADFVSKLHIALKEANENLHWLNVLKQGGYITIRMYESMTNDCTEICKLLATIILHTKQNMSTMRPSKG